MSMKQPIRPNTPVSYPTSDGQPMADNTKQFRWIQIIHAGLSIRFRDRADVFVASDLLWYPVEGKSEIRRAPDALVVFGRPPGDRGAYLQWEEDDIAPQVVFEIRSPSNTNPEMADKFRFYEQYGVEEYYVYDPDRHRLHGWMRTNDRLSSIAPMQGWVSPLLGIRFTFDQEELVIYHPNGERFATPEEIDAQRRAEQERAEQAETQVQQERTRAEQERERAEQERIRAEQAETQVQQERERVAALLAYLQAHGLTPPV